MPARYTLYWDVSSMAPLPSCLFMWYSCAYTSEASTFHSANGDGRTAAGRMPGGHDEDDQRLPRDSHDEARQ